jgi:hypothetical protein
MMAHGDSGGLVSRGVKKTFRVELARFGEKERITGFACDEVYRKAVEEVFGKKLDGALLLFYMVRRFGWPNKGSDDLKELCNYALTTPMKGFWVEVTPRLHPESHWHFRPLMTESRHDELRVDRRGLRRFYVRLERWAKKTLVEVRRSQAGDRKVIYDSKNGNGKPRDWIVVVRKEGDREHLPLPRRGSEKWMRVMGVIHLLTYRGGEGFCKLKCRVRRENRRLLRRMVSAFKRTMKDLLRATCIRDHYFSVKNRDCDPDGTPEEVAVYKHAGCTPKYLAMKKWL